MKDSPLYIHKPIAAERQEQIEVARDLLHCAGYFVYRPSTAVVWAALVLFAVVMGGTAAWVAVRGWTP